jgi:S1-C subfamily serine protease
MSAMNRIPRGVRLILNCASLIVLVCSGGLAFGQTATVTPDVIERVSKAVVLLKGATDGGTVVGSGFVLSSDGKIVTNLHVIRSLKAGGVQLSSGETYDSFNVLAYDERKDIAIIQIAGFDLATLELGNSNEVRIGEPVVAIGSPRGLQGTVTAGVVSSVRDDPASSGFKVIQTDAAANPGNSGGPLVNSKGQVIGIVTSKLRASEGLNFAIPINYVRGLMGTLGKPLTLDGLRGALNAALPDVFKEAASFPASWKSMVSGNRFKIQEKGEVVYVERLVDGEAARVGYFAAWELRKGEKGYKGTLRSVVPCSYTANDWSTLGTKEVVNRCSFQAPAEFSLFSEIRIEGRISAPPENTKLNCRKCTYDKPFVWHPFIWIPEQ